MEFHGDGRTGNAWGRGTCQPPWRYANMSHGSHTHTHTHTRTHTQARTESPAAKTLQSAPHFHAHNHLRGKHFVRITFTAARETRVSVNTVRRTQQAGRQRPPLPFQGLTTRARAQKKRHSTPKPGGKRRQQAKPSSCCSSSSAAIDPP